MISIIISTYNSEKYIEGCLEAVLGSRGAKFEVIVVDAGTEITNYQLPITNEFLISKLTFSSRKLLFAFGKNKNFKLIKLKKNVGLTVSNNAGARIARGEYLLFLDVDTKLDKNALFEIVKFFEKNPKAGAVQGKIIDKDGNIETMGHFLSRAGFPWERTVNEGDRGDKGKKGDKGKNEMIFGARGACLGVRKSVFEKIGGFDTDFFMHNEETDLCWRIWLAGYRIYYLPRAVCMHYGKSHYSVKSAASLRVLGARSHPDFIGTGSGCAPKTLEASPQYLTPHNRLFYEGAKNQITMIIKNAPLSVLIYMLPLNILGWMILGFKSFWVYKGMGRAFLELKKTIRKRRGIRRIRERETREIMFGNISFVDLLKKGWKWSKSL